MTQDVYMKIYLPLSKDEFIALQDMARKNYRHPREQARFILRSVLFGKSDEIESLTNRIEALEQDYERRQAGK